MCWQNRLSICLVCFFLFFHFAMTALYLAPINPATSQYLPIVQKYIEPLFIQNWSLFAPEPATNSLEFHIRCGEQGANSKWRKPFSGLLSLHTKYRIFHHGKLYFLLNGPVAVFYNSLIAKKEKFESKEFNPSNYPGFSALKKIALKSCADLVGEKNENARIAQFRIWFRQPPNFSKRVLSKEKKLNLKLVFQSSLLNFDEV